MDRANYPFYWHIALCRYYKFIVCKQDNNSIGTTLFNGRTLFAPTTVSHNTIYKLLLFMLQNIVVFWIIQPHSLQFTQGHSIHFFIIYNIPTNPNLLNNLPIYAKTKLKTNLQNWLIFTHRHNWTNFSHKQIKIKIFSIFSWQQIIIVV